jgi:threonine dehydratase
VYCDDATLLCHAGDARDGDFDMARERAAAIARYDGIRLVEDSLDIETCEGAATIGLELVDTVPSFDAR